MTSYISVRRAATVLLTLSPVLFAGCGGSTGTVSGTITLAGTPVGQAVVSFVAPDGTIQSAITDANGKYSVEGVPTGTVQVTVAAGEGMDEEGRTVKKLGGPTAEAAKGPIKTPIPARYADSTTSGLTTNVKTGQNAYDIPLNP